MPITIKIVPVGNGSDGDSTHRPGSESTPINPPKLYLEKLAMMWKEKLGESRPGMKYYLDRLPDGYALFERQRPGTGTKQKDAHLYGHPTRLCFRSPNEFYPHFEHLMNNNGNSMGCPCKLCGGKKRSTPVGTNFSYKPKPVGRPPEPASRLRRVDDENVRDTVWHMIDKLKQHGEVDEDIVEDKSMDWRAEHDLLPDMLRTLAEKGSWVPRIAELVLFVREANGEICVDDSVKEHKIFNEGMQRFTGFPNWEAGVIGQTADEVVKLQDLMQEQNKIRNITYSGFRVEPYPDPNGADKSFTKRYTYVPLHHIRPMSCWAEFMKGIPHELWHPTVRNALTVMASTSLFGKYHFKGNWPEASVFFKGIYIGSELICIGDFVRLLPAQGNLVTDILQVKSIKTKLTNLDKASNDDNDEGHPYNTAVYLSGKAFTLDVQRAWSGSQLSRQEVLKVFPGMDGYGPWYHLHDPAKAFQVSYSRVLGRCFEAEPMLIWFPAAEDGIKPELGKGLTGILQAREFSAKHDQRIASGKSWYWGDSRAECLDIESLNSASISYHDQTRDDEQLQEWQDHIKSMDKVIKSAGVKKQGAPSVSHKPSTTRGRNASLVGLAMSSMVQASVLPQEEPQTETDSALDGENEPTVAEFQNRKRRHSETEQMIETSDTEDELGMSGMGGSAKFGRTQHERYLGSSTSSSGRVGSLGSHGHPRVVINM